jgi:hypothetical protein
MIRKMGAILKTLLALGLGLGFLALDAPAQDAVPGQNAASNPTVAFLGIDNGTDPLFGRTFSAILHKDLSADSVLTVVPPRAVDDFLAAGGISFPLTGPADLVVLRNGLAADYYAFGWLEPLSVENSRKWWLPWRVNTEWRRDLRLRVLDGSTGRTVFDGKVEGRVAEKHLFSGPDAGLSGKDPVERDSRQRRMLPVLSSETAKVLARAVASPPAADAAATAGN